MEALSEVLDVPIEIRKGTVVQVDDTVDIEKAA